MALLDIIRDKLIAENIVEVHSTWKCWIGFAPDTTDRIVSLHATGGFPQDTLLNENLRPTFQVRVRGQRLDYSVCEAKWREVFTCLQNADLSSEGIFLVQAMTSGPLEFYDEKERINMSANFQVVQSAV